MRVFANNAHAKDTQKHTHKHNAFYTENSGGRTASLTVQMRWPVASVLVRELGGEEEERVCARERLWCVSKYSRVCIFSRVIVYVIERWCLQSEERCIFSRVIVHVIERWCLQSEERQVNKSARREMNMHVHVSRHKHTAPL